MFLALTSVAAPAWAQLTPEKIAAFTVPIHATQATAMAVHDATGTLIVARKLKEQELEIYTLDDKGVPVGEPTKLKLHVPAEVDKTAWVQDIALHPTLPVAYIWQDLSGVNINQGITGARAEFDHLVVYAIEGPGKLKQIGSYARGEAFTLGQTFAAVGITDDGLRLFMPNVGSAIRQKGQIGYFDLDPETGLPAEKPVPVPGTLDGYGLNQYEMAVRYETIHVGGIITHLPAGLGWYGPTKDVVAFGSQNGIGVWDTTNRRASLTASYMPNMTTVGYLVGHPKSPMLYVVSANSDRAGHQRHVDGYPTLVPKAYVYGGASFRSEPVIITEPAKSRSLVAGGAGKVHFIALDDQWQLTTRIVDVPAGAEVVNAIAWSERFGKLYVPSDNPPATPEEEKEGA